ncbi:N-acetylated-alpha-linked acidic dipeptidase-like protein, partial [Galendromus occidentalis]|uniref:N-acetylated-alpha-linked acidic dipeptidase-like protein n=1 Tax=Galendromus occidentalis TaxID=34638 RepID=A0AAJ7SGQ7_9ACAR
SEDFDVLKSRGVTLNGTIAIMRYGKGQTLAKIKRAEENGIQGVLIYADPFDTESLDTEVPSGPAVPSDAVERGNIKSFPGDPVTPFLPATDDIYRMPRSDVQLPGIPVQPISAEDAQHLLQGIGGPSAPIRWQGRLNLSYNIGPGYKDAAEIEVQLSSFNLFREMNIYNVIGVIPGTHESGRYIIIGCHHDSWTKGAGDPGTGMAVLMEVARMFSDLIRIEGWRPKRTLIFAAWDAAEFGQVGSTEFLQKHFGELSHRTVAYLSLDQAVTGNRSLQVIGSPLLRQVLSEAAEKVPSPGEDQMANSDQNNKPPPPHQQSQSSSSAQHQPAESLYSSWTRAQPVLLNSRRGSVPEIIPPASGADFVPFFQLLGVPIAHFQYVAGDGSTDYPPLRTVYDDFDYIVNFTDPGQHGMAALAQLIAATALKLTDTLQLPVKATDYADQISADFATFQRAQGDFFRTNHIRLDALSAAVKGFSATAKNFQEAFERSAKSEKTILSTLEEFNDRLLQLERSFLLQAAYPRHLHSRHLLYGPDNEDSNKGTLFPHLVMAVRQARKRPISPALSYVRENLSLVLNALRSATGILDKSLLLKSDPV